MIVKILGNIDTPAYKAAEDCVRKKKALCMAFWCE